MTSRERVSAALNHRKPDRTPRLLYGELIGYVPAIAGLLQAHCGPKCPREYFEMDMTAVNPKPTHLPRERFREWLPDKARLEGGIPVDEWGVWRRPGGFEHFTHIESPLAGTDDFGRIKQFPWPDVDASYRYEGMKDEVQKLQQQGVAVAGYAGSVFEQSWHIRGMENLLIDMMLRPEIAHYLLDRTAGLQKACAVQMAKAGVDMIILGDDVAQQRGLMMSIATWREFLKGRLAATCRAAHEAKPDVKVFYHSDGNVEPLIPELIEAGIDVLNPLQPECVNPAEIKAKYGRQLAFFGTVSVQNSMPRGTSGQVRAEVLERIRTVGYDGGLVLAPAHVLSPEVPWENIVAFFEAADGMRL